ncbi:hypothetical protein BHE74_00022892 [Ensete ventricosum]|nr:hypothetical protein GW17_00026705 [Ensete ventricosum]RWW69506.1 hypothetical protein BHE74_00022892 [Ensete ventricosum]
MEAEQQQRPRRKGQKRKLEEDVTAAVSSAASVPAAEEGDEGEAEDGGDAGGDEICCHRSQKTLAREVRTQVEVLDRSFSWRLVDRAAAKRATHILAELAKNGPPNPFFLSISFLICLPILSAEEVVNAIVEGGAVPALVKHLEEPPPLLAREGSAAGGDRPFEHEVEKGCAFALGLLAVKVCTVALFNTFSCGHDTWKFFDLS